MNNSELRQYEVRRGSRYDLTFRSESGRRLMATDGYEFMQAAREDGWRELASWGDPGYDMGSWPLVVVMVRGPKVGAEHDGDVGPFEAVYHVEGDLTYYSFPTNALRRAGLTYLFVWHAVHDGYWDYAKGWDPEDSTTWPDNVHGPYRYLAARQEA